MNAPVRRRMAFKDHSAGIRRIAGGTKPCLLGLRQRSLNKMGARRAPVKITEHDMGRLNSGKRRHGMQVKQQCPPKDRDSLGQAFGKGAVVGAVNRFNPGAYIITGQGTSPNVAALRNPAGNQAQSTTDFGRRAAGQTVMRVARNHRRIEFILAAIEIDPGARAGRDDRAMPILDRGRTKQVSVTIFQILQLNSRKPCAPGHCRWVKPRRMGHRNQQGCGRADGAKPFKRSQHDRKFRRAAFSVTQCWNFLGFIGYHVEIRRSTQRRPKELRRMIRILLAEDEEAMRLYLERALIRSGYAVTSVDRGTAGYALLEAGEQFELLLTDIVMPEMDGIELAQKAAIIAPEMRVMFITGFSAVTLRAGLTLPNAKVLSKPFHLKDLVLEVDRIFEQIRATGLK
jgi:two-component system, cell cycle response regulator CpdR